jgi:CDGSH-type Zn-finger protein
LLGRLTQNKGKHMSAQMTPLKNGPLKVEGEFSLNDSAGKPFTLTAGKAVFLCRCGLSSKKPFCDGSHSKQGFDSDVVAT